MLKPCVQNTKYSIYISVGDGPDKYLFFENAILNSGFASKLKFEALIDDFANKKVRKVKLTDKFFDVK